MQSAACLEPLESRLLLSSDAVLDWNQVWVEVATIDVVTTGPVRASRNAGMLHAAIYDAVASIRDLPTLFASVPDASNASARAAIAGAASRMLTALYPAEEGMIQAALQRSLAAVPDGAREDNGVAVGVAIAEQILAQRATDGSDIRVIYSYSDEPGRYQATSANLNVVDAAWGGVTPFVMDAPAQFRPIAPPELTSAEYAQSYQQVKELGAVDSTSRTADQTEIGYFWAYDRAGLGTPIVMLNQMLQDIAIQQDNNLLDNARLFALVNVAMADTGIATWESKYFYDYWRPVTAIRNGEADGNPLTEGDPAWEPLGAPGGLNPNFTPPFPSYVAGHSSFGSAMFEALRQFYGTDDVSYTLSSDELPGVTRSYSSFTQAELENGISRIYLGIHFGFDDTEGQQLGQDITGLVTQTFPSLLADGEQPGQGHKPPSSACVANHQQSWHAHRHGGPPDVEDWWAVKPGRWGHQLDLPLC